MRSVDYLRIARHIKAALPLHDTAKRLTVEEIAEDLKLEVVPFMVLVEVIDAILQGIEESGQPTRWIDPRDIPRQR